MRQFVVEVQLDGLEPGAHFAEVYGASFVMSILAMYHDRHVLLHRQVCAYDSNGASSKNPLFRIPVTVIIPTSYVFMNAFAVCTSDMVTSNPANFRLKDSKTFSLPSVDFTDQKLYRYFFHVPKDSTWAGGWTLGMWGGPSGYSCNILAVFTSGCLFSSTFISQSKIETQHLCSYIFQ